MSEERRAAKRYTLWIPIQVESGPEVRMLAVSRDISFRGVLVIAGANLTVGERVKLTLQLPGGEAERALAGEIVRVEPNTEDPDGLWRYRLAVHFDDEVPELEPAFERLHARAPR